MGTQFSVEVNVTNVPAFNGFEFRLYYDSRFINATGTNLNGTILTNTLLLVKELSLGELHLAAVNLGSAITTGNGVIAHIFFKVLRVGASPLTLAAGSTRSSSYSFTQLALGGNPIDITTFDGFFKNDPSRLGPVASFTFTPASPILGQYVSFNASTSFDPDNRTGSGIRRYFWDFGDPYTQDTVSPIAIHGFDRTFGSRSGNFSVRLTVFDFDDDLEGMRALRVEIGVHDVAVRLGASPTTVTVGTPVSITANVTNLGTVPETFDLKVEYVPPRVVIGGGASQTIQLGETRSFGFTLDTSSIPPGHYDIVANATDPLDQVPSNNVAFVSMTLRSTASAVAVFGYTPLNPLVGDIVYFDGSNSYSPNGPVVTWNWVWGDGLSESYGPASAWHIYSKPGDYTVTLTVVDTTGTTGTTNRTITVDPAPGTVPHPPIIINDNNGFNTLSGVRLGSGTASDPYVIEGWEMDSSNANGITISNTDVYFAIRNVVVRSNSSSNLVGYIGIQLTRVANGRIEGSTLTTNNLGGPRIKIMNSNHVTVSGNRIFGPAVGISCKNSNNITISGNIISRTTLGISPENSTNIKISGNVLSDNSQIGLFLVQSSQVSVVANDFSRNTDGIHVQGSSHVSMTGNNITSNVFDGIILEPTQRLPQVLTTFVTISDNVISENGFSRFLDITGSGIDLVYSRNVTIVGNDLLRNHVQARSYPFDDSWDAGYPGGGNYWSDYGGVDKCAGPGQNICTTPDGIGDTPYNITTAGVDHYPLMRPATLGPETVPPGWMSGTQLSVSGLEQTSLVLAWSPASDDNRVIQYRVYKNSTLLATLPGYMYTYNVTGLSLGTSYTFKIEAGDVANNWSTTGPSTSVTTLAPPGPSSTPPGSPAGSQPTTFWQQYWWPVAVAVVVTVATTVVTLLRRRRGPRSKTPA